MMRFKTLKGFVSVLFLLLILASTDVIAVQRAKTQSKRRTALELVKKRRSLQVQPPIGLQLTTPA